MDTATALDVVYVVRSPWELGWDSVVALATFGAALVALWVGFEPRRLNKKQNRELGKAIAIVIAAELEVAYTAVKGVVDHLSIYGESQLSLKDAKWVQYYLLSARFDILEKIVDRLSTFDQKIATELARLYVDAKRTRNALAPNGMTEAVDFDGILANDLQEFATPLLKSIESTWNILKLEFGVDQNLDKANQAASIITTTISANSTPPRTNAS